MSFTYGKAQRISGKLKNYIGEVKEFLNSKMISLMRAQKEEFLMM